MSYAVVVPVSGGKDSEACLKLAVQKFGPSKVLGLFCNTGHEHPLTIEHIKSMGRYYGVKIEELNEAGTVESQVLKWERFPGSVVRFCTDQLKIIPSKKFYKLMSEQYGGFEVWYGMRTAESTDRGKRYADIDPCELYDPKVMKYPKYLGDKGVKFRFPVVDWWVEEVFSFLGDHINPLYARGFDRVGCFPCYASTKRHHRNAFEFDEFGASQKVRLMKLEDAIGKKHLPGETDQLCISCQL